MFFRVCVVFLRGCSFQGPGRVMCWARTDARACRDGETPLCAATRRKHWQCVEALIAAKAKVNAWTGRRVFLNSDLFVGVVRDFSVFLEFVFCF